MDHRVHGRALLAGAAMLEAATACARMLKQDSSTSTAALGQIGFVGAMLLSHPPKCVPLQAKQHAYAIPLAELTACSLQSVACV